MNDKLLQFCKKPEAPDNYFTDESTMEYQYNSTDDFLYDSDELEKHDFIIDNSEEITAEEFLEITKMEKLPLILNSSIENDWAVSYYKSITIDGKPCVYIWHSGWEFIYY